MYKFDEDLIAIGVEHFGKESRFNQMQEECCELAVAVSHHRRKKSPKTALEVLEEIGDVALALAQARFIFGDLAVDNACAASARKFAARLETDLNILPKHPLTHTENDND